jgi:hypothetical protein
VQNVLCSLRARFQVICNNRHQLTNLHFHLFTDIDDKFIAGKPFELWATAFKMFLVKPPHRRQPYTTTFCFAYLRSYVTSDFISYSIDEMTKFLRNSIWSITILKAELNCNSFLKIQVLLFARICGIVRIVHNDCPLC